jgi:hypothetical protein
LKKKGEKGLHAAKDGTKSKHMTAPHYDEPPEIGALNQGHSGMEGKKGLNEKKET